MQLITFCLVVLAGIPIQDREWTTTSGFKFEARLMCFEGDQIQLQLEDGPITVPLSLLSAADRQYIERVKGPGVPHRPVVVAGPVMPGAPVKPAAPVVPAGPRRPTIAEIAEERVRAWQKAERERQEALQQRGKSRKGLIRVNGCG